MLLVRLSALTLTSCSLLSSCDLRGMYDALLTGVVDRYYHSYYLWYILPSTVGWVHVTCRDEETETEKREMGNGK